jgi:plastocyanin
MFSRTTGRIVGALLLVVFAAVARADTIQVRMEKLVVVPVNLSAYVGDTIEWVNADFVAHTATARNGAFDVMLPPNTTKGVVLKAEGVIDYYCKFHPNMTGQITVAK